MDGATEDPEEKRVLCSSWIKGKRAESTRGRAPQAMPKTALASAAGSPCGHPKWEQDMMILSC